MATEIVVYVVLIQQAIARGGRECALLARIP